MIVRYGMSYKITCSHLKHWTPPTPKDTRGRKSTQQVNSLAKLQQEIHWWGTCSVRLSPTLFAIIRSHPCSQKLSAKNMWHTEVEWQYKRPVPKRLKNLSRRFSHYRLDLIQFSWIQFYLVGRVQAKGCKNLEFQASFDCALSPLCLTTDKWS